MSSVAITTVLGFPHKGMWNMPSATVDKPLLRRFGKFLANDVRGALDPPPKFTQTAVAQYMGWTQAHISKIEKGMVNVWRWHPELQWKLLKAYRLSDEEALEAAERFNLDIPPRQPSIMNLQSDVPVKLGRQVNVYPAGTGPAWDLAEVVEVLYLPEGSYPNQEVVGLKAMSNSMEPYLPKFAVAIIVLDDGTCQPGDYCGVWIADDGVVIKRFVKELPGGMLLLESLNPGPGEDRFFTPPLGSRIMGKVDKRVLNG